MENTKSKEEKRRKRKANRVRENRYQKAKPKAIRKRGRQHRPETASEENHNRIGTACASTAG